MLMNTEDLIKKEWDEKSSVVVWSETLQTVSGCRVAMLNMDSYMLHEGYAYVAMIDYGNEVGVETYNEAGEWNVGVLHPMNIIKKTPA
tara:strand:- start:160 stop:423 length:264 start_codon:yes stop_codon:yes gene_type:complete